MGEPGRKGRRARLRTQPTRAQPTRLESRHARRAGFCYEVRVEGLSAELGSDLGPVSRTDRAGRGGRGEGGRVGSVELTGAEGSSLVVGGAKCASSNRKDKESGLLRSRLSQSCSHCRSRPRVGSSVGELDDQPGGRGKARRAQVGRARRL